MAQILVVDDQVEIQQLLSTILEDEGHEVSVAGNGRAAVEQIVKGKFQVVVLDVMMPKLDGYGVLRELRHMVNRPKIIMLTAKTSEADWARGYALGADQYLTKPFDVDDVNAAIHAVLAMSQEELADRREGELDKAKLLARIEALLG